MVASVILARELALAVDGAAEFAAEDNERVVQQAALLEIFHQGGGRLISVDALVFDLRRQRAVLIPAAVENLHHAHAPLHQPPRKQCRMGVGAGLGGVRVVHLSVALLAVEISEVRHARLHTKSHLVLRNARLCFGIAKALEGLFVQLTERIQHRAFIAGIHAGGFFTYNTGSPLPRNFTPSYLDARNPLDHMRVKSVGLGFLTVA